MRLFFVLEGGIAVKAAVYCRLSEEDKNKNCKSDDSESIKNQKALLTQYALDNGWDIYGVYSDDDYTGSDRRRPEFNRLLSDAREHKFDIVLCKTQSRFTRELELVEKYIHGLFPIWGIRFISIVDNADTENKGNKKSRQINGLVNEWYLEDMSDNIKSVLTNRRKNGFHIGSFALYGYKKDPEKKGHLIIDDEAAAVVRRVFELFAKGYGKTAIARMLNEKGIPNPTEYKRLHGLRYKHPARNQSSLWKYNAIASMLKNEIYIGNMVQGKYGSVSYKTKQNKQRPKDEWYIVEGTHEPIIERELWDRVQNMLTERTKPFSGGKIGIFTGKVRCAGCGHVMRSFKKSDGKHYLSCSTRFAAKAACEGACISVERLIKALLQELNRLSGEYLIKDGLEEQITTFEKTQELERTLLADISLYEKRMAEYEKGLCDAYMDKVRGNITADDFALLSKSISSDRERLKQMAQDAYKNLETLEKSKSSYGLIEKYAYPVSLNRETVEILVESVFIGKRIPGTRKVPIEIHWNF